jgi:hypothetical protein
MRSMQWQSYLRDLAKLIGLARLTPCSSNIVSPHRTIEIRLSDIARAGFRFFSDGAATRAWPALATKTVAAATLDSSGPSASPMTGGLSTTMRSEISMPTDRNECMRAPPSRSAALGGSGPEATKARLRKPASWMTSGGDKAPASKLLRPVVPSEICDRGSTSSASKNLTALPLILVDFGQF